MKTKISLIVAILLSAVSIAQISFTVDGLNYQRTSVVVNEVRITGGTLTTTDLVIPDTVSDGVDDFTVVEVGNAAFQAAGLTSVTLPNTMRNIDDFAFQNNQLTSLSLPDGLARIGFRAFRINDLTGELVIPNSVTSIGNASFEANQISSIVISENITDLGNFTFSDNNLTSITIPTNVTRLGRNTFRDNPLVEVISLAINPPSIVEGFEDSFEGSRVNIDLTVPTGREAAYNTAGWTGFNSVNGVINIQVGTTFIDNNLDYIITSITPNEVEVTGGASIPSNLVLPQTVSFQNQSYTLVGVGEGAFQAAGLTSLSLPDGLKRIDFRAFQSNELAGELIIPNSVTSISNASFEDNQISSVVIPENLTNLGNLSFRLNNLTTVTIPANVTRIGNSTFQDNPLTGVISLATNPPSIITGGSDDSFRGIRGNIDLTIPTGREAAYETAGWTGFRSVNGVFQIGRTFTDNDLNYRVTSVNPNEVQITGGTAASSDLVIPQTVSEGVATFTVTSVGADAFKQKGLTSINFPSTITAIGVQAFQQNSITNLVLPEGLISMDFRAFQGSNIVSLSLPNGLISIGEASFSGNRIANLNIPASVSTIEAIAFRNNPLTSLTLSEGLVTIGDEAFRINQLSSLTLPSTVTSVGARAFETNNLTTINSQAVTPPTVTTGISDTFGNRTNIDLFVLAGTTQAYEAEGWTGFKSITEVDPINLKVFLQGATLNPIAGEEDLMRDDLRTSGVLQDFITNELGDPIDPAFAIEGPKAVVDFITVELRIATNNNILGRLSALLHRDGTVTIENLEFFLDEVGTLPETILIAIYHRNHIPIITANPVSTLGASITVDFTDPTQVQGGSVALQQVGDRFTMIAGDPNNDGQVLSTDLIQVVSEIGASGYSNSDLDMNGQILSTDILIGNQNIGRGQQFSDPVQEP